jgi:hypothetical protein
MFLLHHCHSKSGTLLCSSILMCSHESLTHNEPKQMPNVVRTGFENKF